MWTTTGHYKSLTWWSEKSPDFSSYSLSSTIRSPHPGEGWRWEVSTSSTLLSLLLWADLVMSSAVLLSKATDISSGMRDVAMARSDQPADQCQTGVWTQGLRTRAESWSTPEGCLLSASGQSNCPIRILIILITPQYSLSHLDGFRSFCCPEPKINWWVVI